MAFEIKKNQGQVTIFIILGVLIVLAIVIALLFQGKQGTQKPTDLGPTGYVQDCVKDSLEPIIQTILDNGGRIDPQHYINYREEKYNYLCFQADYYIGCYNTHPMLEMIVEREILEDSRDEVQTCFNNMKEDLEEKGYTISGGATNYSIDIVPGELKAIVTKEITVSRDGSSMTYEDFSTSINSPLYDLIRVSREIVNSETQFCNFEYNGFMLLYPKYDIKRIDYSDNKLYKVIDRETGDEFRFAVRSCVFPPGV